MHSWASEALPFCYCYPRSIEEQCDAIQTSDVECGSNSSASLKYCRLSCEHLLTFNVLLGLYGVEFIAADLYCYSVHLS